MLSTEMNAERSISTVAGPPSGRFRVGEAMHHGVLTCARDASLADVAALMASRRVHCIVVTDQLDHADSLWGVVSDLDLVAAACVRDLDEQTAEASAATAALTISPEETLQRAAQGMTEHGTAHLIVVDRADRPVGVISTLDVAAILGDR
jgi:CBS domain-containing protein